MEAYFHNDPRIAEWIDQITEKVFTVCLLTGIDADFEFQRGSEIVAKVSIILLGISMFPSELLEDGLRQLLEQQLPDDRVIKNFPQFYDILNKMLHEGISKALEGRQDEAKNEKNIITLDDKEEIVENGKDEPTENKMNEEFHHSKIEGENKESSELTNQIEIVKSADIAEAVDKALNEKIVNEMMIPALAVNKYSTDDSREYVEECSSKDFGEVESDLGQKDLKLDNERESEENKHTILKHVLNRIFPSSSVRWNITVNGQKFEAQVENILINFSDSKNLGFKEESLKKEGWKVFICNPGDLSFPRRVEREIREILRSGNKSLIV